MQNLSIFQVYNASAGSGKTFTLVKEYLKILLQSEDVFRFQKVLAITFTNKASGEMKERILESLDEFSKGKKSKYLPIILEETLLDPETIKDRSGKILNAILQNYAAFSITTIDSFTHKIIKNFAYDLGLTLNFEVEMDAVSLLNEAVDVLISKIGTDKELTKLLIDFSLSKTDDDKSWDISRELNEFSKILLNEDDTKHFRKLAKKSLNDFTELKNKLKKNEKIVEEQLKEIGKKSLQIIADVGLEFKDFTRQTFPKFLNDLSVFSSKFDYIKRSDTIEKAIANHTFYNKTASDSVKNSIESILPELINLFRKSKSVFGQKCLNELALKSIIPLAVLNNINSELTRIKEDNNIRLNAEFNQLISDNIKNQPAPFIYERIGQRFMYYFIDEMQDTSVLQWQNLIPLIDNALAQENSNLLLVGDGKQAIYRWRGGKAEQFIELGDKSVASPFQIEKSPKNLATNFRSFSEIINFNNNFFQHTANFLQNDTYKKLFLEGNNQKENAKKGGFVSISFLEKEEEKEDEKLKYPKKVLGKINELKSDFSLNEICVLVRKKRDGIAVANYLSENGVNIISSETLLLQNSSKVNFLMNVLQVIQHPKDEETRFELLYFLYKYLGVVEDKHSFFNRFAKQPIEAVFQQLKTYGVCFDLTEYSPLPLYEKVENIIRGFKILISSDAYVQFFLDVVLDQQRRGASVQDFLDFWEEKKDKLSIVAPESSNAVQIMTIHKSKGLQFPVVIFPYDLNIYKQINPKIWMSNLPEDYVGFEELLLEFNTKIKYVSDEGLEMYQKAREELELDNFNLLYVALTRAVEQLHVITEFRLSTKGENTDYYSGVFINYLKDIGKWDDEVLEYSFGNTERIELEENEIKEDVEFKMQEQFVSTSWKEHNVKLLASSSKLWDTEKGKAIDFGNLIHEMMSKIYTKEDIEIVVNQYEKRGEFTISEKEKINTYIYGVIEHPQLKEYFTKNVTVYNEREISPSENRKNIIPDKLVFKNNIVTIIDYKTGKPNKKYEQQLNGYENVLTSMSFSIDKKLLVYINDEILVKEL